MDNTDEHFFYINWEDSQKNPYRIGILAKIDNAYYLKTYERRTGSERDAYSRGYIGIPGFVTGRLYKSTNQMFDFFKRRIYIPAGNGNNIDFFTELKRTSGRTLTDSFFVEEMPEKYRNSCKRVLLALDKLQEEAKNNKLR